MKKHFSITKRRSVYRAVSYFIQRWILHRPFLTARLTSIGLVFKVKTEDVVGRHIYKYHAHEPELSEWLVQNLNAQEGDVFIDIGANLGWYSVLFDALAKSGSSVFAFEPDPFNCGLLRTNLEMNHASSVRVFEAAVGERSGRSKLYLYNNLNLGRHSMLNTNNDDSIEVEAVSLADFWDQQGLAGRTVRALKIDVEGYEYFALNGAQTVLESCKLVICEHDPAMIRAFGLNPEAVPDLLEQAGMTPWLFTNGNLGSASREILLSNAHGMNVIWRRT